MRRSHPEGLQARAVFKLTSHLVNKGLRTELWCLDPVSVRVQLTTRLGGSFPGAIKLAEVQVEIDMICSCFSKRCLRSRSVLTEPCCPE